MESSWSRQGRGGCCHTDRAPGDNEVDLISVEVVLFYLSLFLTKIMEFLSLNLDVVLSPICTLDSLWGLFFFF